MVAVNVLRSVGMQFHPVGPLTVQNKVQNPNMKLVDGSNNITQFAVANCLFVQNLTQFKYGKESGKVTFNDTGHVPSILQSFTVNEGQDYTASGWFYLPSALSTGISIYGQCYAPDGTPMDLLGGPVLNGAATSGFIRTSILLSAPVGANRMDVSFIQATTTPSVANQFFYVDALQFEPSSTAGTYVDGDMAGYCWAGTQGLSDTLKTEFPDALRTFDSGDLDGAVGGMRSRATLLAPNIVPFQS